MTAFLGLLLGGITAPASATPAGAPAGTGDAASATSVLLAARTQAEASGQAVPVDALETGSYLVTANPDGTFSSTTDLQPVRVRQNGAWVPVDATLAADPSTGLLSPRATPNQVSLSSGGSGPLATLTDPDGHRLALTMPFPLPAPEVSGDTALYRSVLPGVDLSVAVTDQGGFSDVLIVHNARAAADPQLRRLTMAASTSGLTLAATPSGGMAATTAGGELAYSSPAPIMWDSSTAVATPATKAAGTRSAALARSTGADPAADAGSTPAGSTSAGSTGADDPAVSTTEGPGTAAQVAPVAMSTGSAGLTLTPDPSALAGQGVDYPVFIDPYTNPITKNSGHYDEVYSSSTCDNSPQYDTPQSGGEGVGYQHWGGSCGNGLERSYYAIPTSGLASSMQVNTAKISVQDTYAASFNCSENQPVTLDTTGSINSSTDWLSKPAPADGYAAVGTTVSNGPNSSSSCSGDTAVFTLNTQAQKVIDNVATIPYWTVVLYGDETVSSSNNDFLRFSSSLKLDVNFDIPPAVSNPHMDPVPQNPSGPDCGGSTANAGWIGATTTSNDSSNIRLHTTVTTYVTNEQAHADFRVWDNYTANSSGGSTLMTSPSSGTVSSGADANVLLGFTVKDGHRYQWDVQAQNNSSAALSSAWYASCYFSVDATPPATPTVDSNPSFPAVGGGAPNPVVYAGVGQHTSFTVHAADVAPADSCTLTVTVCQASGVDHFLWALDRQPTTADHDGSVDATGTVANTATATASITVPVTTWGVHNLYVAAVDRVGNPSQAVAQYTFTAPWNPNTKVTAGDITGDGVPDLLAATTSGSLELIPGDTDPASAAGQATGATPSGYPGPVIVSTAAQTPNAASGPDSWNNYRLAHRGSLTGHDVDDLFALDTKTTPKQLYVVKNDLDSTNGTVGGFSLHKNLTLTKPADCLKVGTAYWAPAARCSSAGYGGSWDAVSQIAAPGAVYPADPDTNNGKPLATLVTMEAAGGHQHLWIYQYNGAALVNPILLGDGNWDNFTLVTPGTVGGTVSNGTAGGGTSNLWVRDDLTGGMYYFDISYDSVSQMPNLIHAPFRTAFQSAVTGTGGALCLDDYNSGTANGTKIDAYTCNTTRAQSFTPVSDGSLRVYSLCLDVTSSGTADGTPVQLYTCNSTGAQQWSSGSNGSLVNSGSGKCLTDPGGSTTPGTQVVISTCDGSASQSWTASAPTGWSSNKAKALPLRLPAGDYPTVASAGDVNSPTGGPDGNPDLYVVDAHNQLVEYPGVAPDSWGTPGFGAAVPLSLVPGDPSARWQLNAAGSPAPDDAGTNPATLYGAAAWATDSTHGTVLSLNGTTGYAESATAAVTTATHPTGGGTAVDSYTVAAWVQLTGTSANSTFVSQSDSAGNANGFQLYYSSGAGVWAFGRHNDDTTGPDFTSVYGPAAVVGAWTHLVGVYDGSSNQLRLYVNGALVKTTVFKGTNWAATGRVEIGRRLYEGAYAEYANAKISDVQIYDYALNPAGISAIAGGPQAALHQLD